MSIFYKTYDEIPVMDKEYIITVTQAKTIQEVPLSDINSFLTGLVEYYKMDSENDGGWVL